MRKGLDRDSLVSNIPTNPFKVKRETVRSYSVEKLEREVVKLGGISEVGIVSPFTTEDSEKHHSGHVSSDVV